MKYLTVVYLLEDYEDPVELTQHPDKLDLTWGHAIRDRNETRHKEYKLRDENRALRKALNKAADVLEKYAAIHRAKGTPDGDKKAISNELLSAEMRRAMEFDA
jgi:hypothetical protein